MRSLAPLRPATPRAFVGPRPSNLNNYPPARPAAWNLTNSHPTAASLSRPGKCGLDFGTILAPIWHMIRIRGNPDAPDKRSGSQPLPRPRDGIPRQREDRPAAIGVPAPCGEPKPRKAGRPRIEDIASTIEAQKPWLALGMSRRTWFRRQAERNAKS